MIQLRQLMLVTTSLALPLVACGTHRSDVAVASQPRIEAARVTFPPRAPQLAYVAVEAARPSRTITSAVNGRLAWDDELTARILAPVSGRVTAILAAPGDTVRSGQPLLGIRSPEFAQAQADARRAAADLDLAGRALVRTRELLAHGAAAAKELEAAEADRAHAVAEQQRAAATLALYGGQGDRVDARFTLAAPIGGMVVERNVNPGQEVRADQASDKPLFVISEPSRLWLYLDVGETDLGALREQQPVLVRSRAFPGETFHGRIERIGAALDPATRTAKVRCVVDNPQRRLKAEMYVSAEIDDGTALGLEVPTRAIFLQNDQRYVFVETASGSFERRPVRVGPESADRAVIVEGLERGQRVVTEGSLLLQSMLDGTSS